MQYFCQIVFKLYMVFNALWSILHALVYFKCQINSTHTLSLQNSGFGSRFPLSMYCNNSWFATAGYGVRPSVNTSQQVTPYDHYS